MGVATQLVRRAHGVDPWESLPHGQNRELVRLAGDWRSANHDTEGGGADAVDTDTDGICAAGRGDNELWCRTPGRRERHCEDDTRADRGPGRQDIERHSAIGGRTDDLPERRGPERATRWIGERGCSSHAEGVAALSKTSHSVRRSGLHHGAGHGLRRRLEQDRRNRRRVRGCPFSTS